MTDATADIPAPDAAPPAPVLKGAVTLRWGSGPLDWDRPFWPWHWQYWNWIMFCVVAAVATGFYFWFSSQANAPSPPPVPTPPPAHPAGYGILTTFPSNQNLSITNHTSGDFGNFAVYDSSGNFFMQQNGIAYVPFTSGSSVIMPVFANQQSLMMQCVDASGNSSFMALCNYNGSTMYFYFHTTQQTLFPLLLTTDPVTTNVSQSTWNYKLGSSSAPWVNTTLQPPGFLPTIGGPFPIWTTIYLTNVSTKGDASVNIMSSVTNDYVKVGGNLTFVVTSGNSTSAIPVGAFGTGQYLMIFAEFTNQNTGSSCYAGCVIVNSGGNYLLFNLGQQVPLIVVTW